MRQISHSFKILPLLVCRKEIMSEEEFKKRLRELNENLKVEAQILRGVIISEESDLALLADPVKRADVILLYKPYLGLPRCVVEIAEYGVPIILFREPYKIHSALDALEYIWNKKDVWIAIDYQDINSRLKLLRVKKEIEDTKILILNSDYSHWRKWLLHVFGGVEAIKERFGIEVEYVESDEVLKRWKAIQNERVRDVGYNSLSCR